VLARDNGEISAARHAQTEINGLKTVRMRCRYGVLTDRQAADVTPDVPQ
jgi:hypothetical protein